MPDTETLDRVLDIITRVPHLHRQMQLAANVQDPAAAREELRAAPDVRRLVAPRTTREWPTRECGSAYCFAGWALILKGYTERYWDFWPPLADLDRSRCLGDPLAEAEVVLGIDLHVLGGDAAYLPTLFGSSTTLPQIRAWVAFYKQEIDKETLITLLELHMEED